MCAITITYLNQKLLKNVQFIINFEDFNGLRTHYVEFAPLRTAQNGEIG